MLGWRKTGLAAAVCAIAACGPTGPAAAPSATVSPKAAPTGRAFAPDGPPVFVSQRVPLRPLDFVWTGDDRAIVILDRREGLYLADAVTGEVRAAWRGCMQDMALAKDAGVLFYLTCRGRDLGRIELSTGRLVEWSVALGNPETKVWTLPNARAVLLTDHAGAWVRDGGTGDDLFVLRAPESGYRALLPPDGSVLAISSQEAITIHWFDYATRFRTSGMGTASPVIAFSPDGARLAVGRADDAVFLDAKKGAVLGEPHHPCGTSRTERLAFSPDGQTVAASCAAGTKEGVSSTRVTLSDSNLDRSRTVAIGEIDPPYLRFSKDGSSLASISRSCGTVLLKVASGEKIAHVLPRCRSIGEDDPVPIAWNGDLTKAAVSEEPPKGEAERGPHVIDTDRRERLLFGTFRAKPAPAGDPSGATPDDQQPSPMRERDPADRFEMMKGRSRIPIVREIATGKHIEFQRSKDERDIGASGFSSRQTYIVAVKWAEDYSVSSSVLVWSTQSGKLLAEIRAGIGYQGLDVSPDETGVAIATVRRSGCGEPDACAAVSIHELPSGKKRVSIGLPDVSGPEFSSDSTMILTGRDVYDARTGKRLYSLQHGHIAGWAGKPPMLVVERDGSLELVDPRRGVAVPVIKRVISVDRIRDDGQSVLVDLLDGMVLVDVQTRTSRKVPLPFGRTVVGFVGNRDIVRLVDDRDALGRRSVIDVRVADGRALSRHGALVATDEGVFDGPESSWFEGAFRLGPDLVNNRMVPLAELAKRYHRPGLEKAFLAGEDVSPAR